MNICQRTTLAHREGVLDLRGWQLSDSIPGTVGGARVVGSQPRGASFVINKHDPSPAV